jgi:hypothetical protein
MSILQQAPIPTDFAVSIAPKTPGDDTEATDSHYLLPAARDAYLVFDDICLLVNGEQPSFLKLQSLPRTFGLELIESVLSDFSNVFITVSFLPNSLLRVTNIIAHNAISSSIPNYYTSFAHCCRLF